MNSKTLTGMIALSALLLVGAQITAPDRGTSGSQTAEDQENAFPALMERPGDIASVYVQAADHSLRLERRAEDGSPAWLVAESQGEPLGYPANPKKVNALLFDLGRIQFLEPRTANPAFYDRLEVEAPSTPGAKSRLVRVEDREGENMAALILGKPGPDRGTGQDGKTVYVRDPQQEQAWLAAGELDAPGKALDWMQTGVLNMREDRVQRVIFRPGQDDSFTLERNSPDEKPFRIPEIPAGRALRPGQAVESLAFGLEYLDFEEVKARPQGFDVTSLPVAVRYIAFDGLVVDVRLMDDDGANWTLFQARYDDGQAKKYSAIRKNIEEKETGTATDNPEKNQKSSETPDETSTESENMNNPSAIAENEGDLPENIADAKEEAINTDRLVRNWMYRLPSWKQERYSARLEDLLEPVTPAPEADPARAGQEDAAPERPLQ